MQTFSVQDVERVLRLSRSTIRGLIKTGFVNPARGPKRQLMFSFQDLIVLRAARALLEAKISRRRINRSLEDLRRHLPEQVPLSGLSISAMNTAEFVTWFNQDWVGRALQPGTEAFFWKGKTGGLNGMLGYKAGFTEEMEFVSSNRRYDR